MALYACPECGKQVSSAAVSCPNCGMVLSGGTTAAPGSHPGVVFSSGAAAAPAPEQTLWEGGPSLALVYGKLFGLFIRLVILIVLGYLIIEKGLPALVEMSPEFRDLIEPKSAMISWAIVILFAISLVPSVSAIFSAIAQIKNTHYKVTNQRILIERGVLSKSLEEIDMRSVDDTEFSQRFIERIFGIGEVSIVSTDKVVPKVVLRGINNPRNTRELIRATAYQVSQRQLFTRST